MLERIQILDKIDNLFSDGNIGLILARDLTPSDAQKIFNIINSKGEKLTAVEVLSAKPSWNKIVEDPSEAAVIAVKELYHQIGTVYSDVVRWDLPATFTERWGRNLVFRKFSNSKSDFEKKITIGFKILAGIYDEGVKKESIEKLSRRAGIRWSRDFEGIVNDFCTMSKVIESYTYFKYFKSWKDNIMDLTSQAVALDFILLAYLDWQRKDKPVGSDSQTKRFQKNCFILLDRLIYEYVQRQWKGSGDQKIANDRSLFPAK